VVTKVEGEINMQKTQITIRGGPAGIDHIVLCVPCGTRKAGLGLLNLVMPEIEELNSALRLAGAIELYGQKFQQKPTNAEAES
jgi:hypothetical protein